MNVPGEHAAHVDPLKYVPMEQPHVDWPAADDHAAEHAMGSVIPTMGQNELLDTKEGAPHATHRKMRAGVDSRSICERMERYIHPVLLLIVLLVLLTSSTATSISNRLGAKDN